jgi:hypothetical protein
MLELLKNRRYFVFLFVLLLIVPLAACGPAEGGTPSGWNGSMGEQPAAPDTLPTPQTLEAGMGGIRGVIENLNWAIPPGSRVYFTVVSRHPTEGWAVFMLDTATTRTAVINEFGFFEGVNLEPGEYVLVVGVDPENASAILREDGQARVYEVVGDEMLDIGTEEIAIAYFVNTPAPPAAYPAPQTGEDAYP